MLLRAAILSSRGEPAVPHTKYGINTRASGGVFMNQNKFIIFVSKTARVPSEGTRMICCLPTKSRILKLPQDINR